MQRNVIIMGAIMSAGCGAAMAQEDVRSASGARGLFIEEVVVTAQRREESLTDIPVSATAFSADMLKDRGVDQVIDLQAVSPSLSVTDTGITLSVNIRGIGIASNSPNITAGVATYLDGLFQPPIVQANSFYDLENVEVLRGPQGTFVGSNSTGGAIFINTRDPQTGEFSGHGEVNLGSYGNRGFEGAVNVPIAEDLAIRLAGIRRNRDSYFEDAGPFDNDAGKLDEYGFRFGLLWNPGAFELLFKTQISERKTGGYAAQPIPGTIYGDFRVGDAYTLDFDEDTFYEDSADITSLELRYELANGVVLRSLTGYQDKVVENDTDLDASQAPLAVNGGILEDYYAREQQYSQELNIISPTDGVFDWVVGGYYQDNDIEVNIVDIQGGFPTDILPANKRITTGVFAQGNYELTSDLELQVGARYSTYEAEGRGGVFVGRGIPGFPPGGLQVADLVGDYDDSRTTGKIALNWQLANDHLLYALLSRGYKPGGSNSQSSTFSAEDVTSYEIGWKFSALDEHLLAQLNVFYNDYSDFQFTVLEPSTGLGGVRNLTDMIIRGVEAQVQARFGGLSITGNAGYTDSDLKSMTLINQRRLPGTSLGPQCPAGAPSNPPICFDYGPFLETMAGGDALYAPELTANLGVAYELFLDNGYALVPRLDYSWTDEQFSYLAYSPVSDTLESRSLLNASVSYSNETWMLELYGRNLTDEEYVSGQFDTTEFYGAPREYGLRLGMNF